MTRAAQGHYPPAERLDLVEVVAGHRIADPYRWLEDDRDPRVSDWRRGQRELFERTRGQAPAREALRRRLTELTAFQVEDPPVWRGSRRFFTRRTADADHPALFVADEGGERVLFDPGAADPSGRTTLDGWTPSGDGRLVAVQTSTGGTERSRLCVLDASDRRLVDGPIGGCRYAAVTWLPGWHAFCYARYPDAAGEDGERLYLHRCGTAVDADVEILRSAAPGPTEIDLRIGVDGRWLVASLSDGVSSENEIWIAEIGGAPARPGTFRVLPAAEPGWTEAVPGRAGLLYLLTDAGSPLGRIDVVDLNGDWRRDRRTLVPEDPTAAAEGAAVLDDPSLPAPLVVSLRRRGVTAELMRHRSDTGAPLGPVDLPGAGTVLALSDGGQGRDLWFTYSDTTTPPTVYRYDTLRDETARWSRSPLPDVPAVRFRVMTYSSSDDTKIRILLTIPEKYEAGCVPTLLHAYGAFGVAQAPDYFALALSWAERGGIFATACVRGGGDNGESWHEAGAGRHKQRGIDDLLAAAGFLVDSGFTRPDMLAAMGDSAGGLLVAAALTQRPDMFAAASCTAPLTDMARYELSGMGRYWTEEFGSREDPVELGWLLGYSPYHAIRTGVAYPAVLFTTFGEDGRVDAAHAWKMCAALQYASAADPVDRPVLLREEEDVGHGDRARHRRLDHFAQVLSFLGSATSLLPTTAGLV